MSYHVPDEELMAGNLIQCQMSKKLCYLNLALISHRDIREEERQPVYGFNFIAAQQPWATWALFGWAQPIFPSLDDDITEIC